MTSSLYFDDAKDWSLHELDIDILPKGVISYGNFNIFSDASHRFTNVPVITACGRREGPTLGLLAVVHGNELNGIMAIHKLFAGIDPQQLSGNVIAIPVVNMPGYLNNERGFLDSTDLNRVMPGKPLGTPAEVYAHRLMERVIRKFDFLIDIHTASFGRINSHYIRADLNDPDTRKMAELQNADIIVHTDHPKGSFRVAANDAGIPAITIELGNPQRFQKSMIASGIDGIRNCMINQQMIDGEIELTNSTKICKKSYWLRVDMGGVLSVHSDLLDVIEKKHEVAFLTDIFGREVKRFYSPEEGIVIGKSTNPVAYTGSRIIHLGILGEPNSDEKRDTELIDDNEDV